MARCSHSIVFDPGQSTGVVLADWPVLDLGKPPTPWADVVWTSHTITEDRLEGWLHERAGRFLQTCAFHGEPVTAIIERPPQRARLPAEHARVITEWLHSWGGVVRKVWASPGEWKPWVKANPLRLTVGSQHERDAASLLRWWLETRKGV